MIIIGLSVLLFSTATFASDVVELTPENFHSKVIQSDELWLVEFYAPWCGHCKNLAPEWEKAATALKGLVKLGAVDADQHRTLGGQYGVQGFPSIKIFGLDKFKPADYTNSRDANGIVNEAVVQMKSMAFDRLKGKSGSKSGSGSGGGSGKKSNPDDVITLTDSNFKKMVLDSDDIWMVEFFAPWCGHCKSLTPHWEKAATELKGKVKLGALDATVHTVTAGKYEVRGFPTIKVFSAGQKDGSAENYEGGRTSGDIIKYGEDLAAENVPAPEAKQINSEKDLSEACEHQLCVIAVLPHILDCQSKCRNDYIKLLTRLGDKYKKKMWGWVWTEAGSQMEMEESLGIGGFGYPAMAAVNARKAKFALLRGSFSEQGLNEFLRDLSFGRGSTAPLKNAKLPEIVETQPWDGKDGVLDVEDDIDLSDVELDDLEDTPKKEEL